MLATHVPDEAERALDRAGAAGAARRRRRRRPAAATSCSAPGGRSSSGWPRPAPVVHRVRGPPLGRHRPARLHRPPARVEPRRPDPVVTLARPELLERRPTGAPASATSLALYLEPLPETAMRELLAGLVPGPARQPAARSIVARADGIPLYAVETVRMLLSRRAGCREADGALSSRSATSASWPCPRRCTALIAARLDGLDPADRALAPGRGRARPELHARRARPRSPARSRPTLEPRLRALVRRELLGPGRSTRARRSAASTPSSRRSSARSPTTRSPSATARPATSPPPASSSRSATDELAGALAGHYLAAWQSARTAPRPTPSRPRPGSRSSARPIAPSPRVAREAVGFLEQALLVTADPSERAPILERAGRAAATRCRRTRRRRSCARRSTLRRRWATRPPCSSRPPRSPRRSSAVRPAEDAGALFEPAVAEAEGVADDCDLPPLSGLARIRFSQDRVEEGLALIDRGLPIAERDELAELLIER